MINILFVLVIGLLLTPAVACSKPAQAPVSTPTPAPTPATAPAPAPKPTPAPSPAPTPTERKPEGKIVVAQSIVEGEFWLPRGGTAQVAAAVLPMYDYLFNREADGRLKPGLVESYEMSPDGKTYTFHLRKGVKFHRGWGEVTAADIKFSMEDAAAPDSLNLLAGTFKNLLKNFEIVDDYTFRLNLEKPQWDVLYNYTSAPHPRLPIISKKYVETVGVTEAGRKPIGTGPYEMVEHRTGDMILYRAVDYKHWRVTPYYKEIEIRLVPEDATRVAMLNTGAADIIELSVTFVNELKSPNRVLTVPDTVEYMVMLGGIFPGEKTFNPNVPWAADPADTVAWEKARKVRKAMNLAIDRETIAKTIFMGYAKPHALQAYFPSQAWYDPKWKPYPYDPEQAKQLLKEAGYPGGFEMRIYTFKMSGRPELPDIAEAAAIYWEKIGLKVKRTPLPQQNLSDLRKNRTYGTNNDLSTFGLMPYDSSIMYLSSIETRGATLPFIYAPYEDLIKKGMAEMNSDKREVIERQVGQVRYDEYIHFPIVTKDGIFGVSPKIGEWPRYPGTLYITNNLEYIKP